VHDPYLMEKSLSQQQHHIPPLLRSFCLCCLTVCLQLAHAQNDRHYNSIQYGLNGIIMNGAMVAGVQDNSAIYYNPASLSIAEVEGLDVSLFALSIDIHNKTNAFGEGNDAKNTNIDFIPGLVTYMQRPYKNQNIMLAGGLFTRQNYNNIASERIITDKGGAIGINEMHYSQSGREFWIAMAAAYKFPKNVALGLSQYFSTATYGYEHELSYQQFDKARTGVLLFEDSERLKYSRSANLGMLNKFGLSWFNDFLSFGLTVTTPTYAYVHRSASVDYYRTRVEGDSTVASSVSFGNKGQLKTPFSTTAGLEWKFKGYRLAMALDYFHSVKEYTLISSDGEDNLPLVNGSEPLELKDSRKRVFNINFGCEVPLTEKIVYLGGFRTNFNYNDQPVGYDQPRQQGSYFDIYHITNGLKVAYNRNRFTVGLDYAFSFNSDLPVIADLEATAIPTTNNRNSSIRYNNMTFLLTYNFILDKLSDLEKSGLSGNKKHKRVIPKK